MSAITPSAAGPPAASKSSTSKVPISAFCESRLTAETAMPAAREKNKALSSARALCQVLRPGDAAQAEGEAQDRQHRQQRIEAAQGGCQQLAQHHVIAPQVGQEQQAQRSLALLFAQAIRSEEQASRQPGGQAQPGQHLEQNRSQAGRPGARQQADDHATGADNQRRQGRRDAQPERAALARRHPQLPAYDRQAVHLSNVCSRRCRRRLPPKLQGIGIGSHIFSRAQDACGKLWATLHIIGRHGASDLPAGGPGRRA